MTNQNLFLALFLSLTFIACNSDDDATATFLKPTIAGTWNLTNVSGGFAGVDSDFEEGLVTWTFNTETSEVTVENTNTELTIFDGLPSGTYDYEFDATSEPQTLNVDFLSTIVLELSSTQMLWDEGVAFDGFLLKFNR